MMWNDRITLALSPQIDYDVCSNYGNWLYSAGIGNDPRENRKFNMIKQGLDYDSEVSSAGLFEALMSCDNDDIITN